MNYDATQYFCPFSDFIVIKIPIIRDVNIKEPVTIEAEQSGEMGIFIKSYTLITAAGYVGPMVLVIADSSMATDEIVIVDCPGVSHLPDHSKVGYIIFTKTRAGNIKKLLLNMSKRHVICTILKV